MQLLEVYHRLPTHIVHDLLHQYNDLRSRKIEHQPQHRDEAIPMDYQS